MTFTVLSLLRRDTGEQLDTVDLTATDNAFIENTALPHLNATENEKVLEGLADALWNLCLWERQRGSTLDTKASALTGLSSLSAAIVTVSAIGPGTSTSIGSARLISIVLFISAVLLSLFAQRAVAHGGFFDADVFAAIEANKKPVGDFPPFPDTDQYRCFLRETALQRWYVYRKQCDANDAKAHRLILAQWGLILAIFSFLLTVAIALIP